MAATTLSMQAVMTRQVEELSRMGARIALLESVVQLPRERLVAIYKETTGHSPPKGQYPFSAKAILAYPMNVQASLFAAFYSFFTESAELENEAEVLKKSFVAYESHVKRYKIDNRVDINRAWTIARFISSGLLDIAECRSCRGRFVISPEEHDKKFVCCLCAPSPQQGNMSKTPPETLGQPIF